jgi:hypothetical protein
MVEEYKTIFEITNKGFMWWFALAGLLPAVPGAVLWELRKSHGDSWRLKWLRFFFPGFALLWLSVATIPMWLEYSKLQNAYRHGAFSTVQGPVEDFHPMPPQGHSTECFSVENQRFCYGDDIMSAGFNSDSAHGGPIRAGLPVRIAYVGNDILKLEVRADIVSK